MSKEFALLVTAALLVPAMIFAGVVVGLAGRWVFGRGVVADVCMFVGIAVGYVGACFPAVITPSRRPGRQ